MPTLRLFLSASLVAFYGGGIALAAAQDSADAAAVPRSRDEDRPGAAPRQADPNPMSMEKLLGLWERQSSLLTTLELSIYRVDKTPGWDEDHFEGKAAFRSPQLAYLDFRKVKTRVEPDPKDRKKERVVPLVDPRTKRLLSIPYESIICTGTEVWDYRYDVRQIHIYTLDKDQRQRALEEGPLPFLFNMKASDARRRYGMALRGVFRDVYFVVVTPKLKDDLDSFKTAWVFLDRAYLLPKRIVLFLPDGQSTQDYNLSNIRANKPVADAFFRGVDPGKPWKIERSSGGQAMDPANAPGRRRKGAGQTARRPAAGDAGQDR